ncbi:MAG: AsmA family protein, partial [Rhodospirillales bacterium]
MKGWKKIVSAVVVLAVAVVAAGIAIIKSLDFNEYRGLIADQVKAATGREMTIAGKLDVKISLTPALAVEGVTFANAPWGSRAQMATLKQLAAEVELLPLLSGDVRVKRLVLTGLDVLVETDAKGRGNWELEAPGKKVEAAKPATETAIKLPVVHAVGMKDIAVAYRDGRTGKTTALRLARLDVEEKGVDAPMTVALTGDFDGKAFEASGRLGPLAALIKGGVPYPVSLRIKALGAEVVVEGVVSEPRAMTGLDLKVQASGNELAETVTAVAAQVSAEKFRRLPTIGPFRIAARVKGDTAKFSLTAIDTAIGKSEQVLATVSGAIADVPTAAGLDLKFSLEGKDASPLVKALGLKLPTLPPFKVAAAVTNPKDAYVVNGLDAKLGGSDLKGRLSVRLAGVPRPHLDAEFNADLLDLDALLPRGPAMPTKKTDRVFPADPLPVDGLKAADGRVLLKAKRIVAGGIAVENIDLGLALAGGRLEVKSIAAFVGGGRINGEAVFDGARPTPAVTIAASARQVDYGAVLQQLQLTGIARGKLDATVDLKGQGGSLMAIMAGLDGRARVVTEGGQIDSGLLNVLSADVTSALPFYDSKGDKTIRCGVIDFDVKKGRAAAKTLVFETGGISMIGSGGINLADETIAINIDPRAKKLSVLKLTLVPVNVGGTLA